MAMTIPNQPLALGCTDHVFHPLSGPWQATMVRKIKRCFHCGAILGGYRLSLAATSYELSEERCRGFTWRQSADRLRVIHASLKEWPTCRIQVTNWIRLLELAEQYGAFDEVGVS